MNPTESSWPIYGMTCASCVHAVRTTLENTPGVLAADVDLVGEQVKVKWQPQHTSPTLLQAALARRGYTLVLPKIAEETTPSLVVNWRTSTTAMWVGYVLTLLLLSGGMLSLFPMPIHLSWGLVWVVLFLNFDMLTTGARRMATGWPSMESLVLLSTATAMIHSTLVVWMPHYPLDHHTYWDDVAVVLTMVRYGKWLEQKAKANTKEALKSLIADHPSCCQVEQADGTYHSRAITTVQPNEHVLVPAFEVIPVDGVVLSGQAEIDERLMTGETAPSLVKVGDKVLAGCRNLGGSFMITATTAGNESQILEMAKVLERGQFSSQQLTSHIDSITRWFVPTVIAIAIAALGGWWLGGELATGLMAFISILVVACPCAIGLATPIVSTKAIGLAARNGILVRDALGFMALKKPATIVFDKTGTLTTGQLNVVDAYVKDPEKHWPMVHALVQASTHPLDTGLKKYLQGLPLAKLQQHTWVPGLGHEATIESHLVQMGSPLWFRQLGLLIPPRLDKFSQIHQEDSLVWVAIDKTLVAGFALADMPRQEASEVIPLLGHDIHLLSGDHEAAVAKVAHKLNLKAFKGGQMPNDKLAYINNLKIGGQTVVMIGDGVNDAMAMQAASASIAMGHGASLAKETSQFILMHNQLILVPRLFDFAKQVRQRIKQNLVWAFGYNLLLIPLAAGALSPWHIHFHPMWGGMAMAISSVLVVANGRRLVFK